MIDIERRKYGVVVTDAQRTYMLVRRKPSSMAVKGEDTSSHWEAVELKPYVGEVNILFLNAEIWKIA